MSQALNTNSTITEQSIVNYGVSEHLKAEFDMLREVMGNHHQAKFSDKTVDTLAQHLVCRHYGNLCYEFSHLNWALVFLHTQGKVRKPGSIQHALLDFYWIAQCQNKLSFMSYFDECCDPLGLCNTPILVSLNKGGANSKAHLDLPSPTDANGASANSASIAGISLMIHEHNFTISASRANLLACFMEWLICVIPNVLSLIEASLLDKGHNGIRDFSSVLQKYIYDYLGEHLPAAKLQLRFRLMQSWYQQHAKAEQGDTSNVSDVSDNAILNFWRAHNKQEGYGKYSSVVKDSLAFKQALQIVQTGSSIQHAVDVDASFDAFNALLPSDDEPHNNEIFTQLSQLDDHYSIDVQCLAVRPKILNKQQLEWLALAARYPQFIVTLSGTWLRMQVFGKTQHQILQQVRMRRLQHHAINSASGYESLCEQNYEHVKHECIALLANNQQTLLAIVDILLVHNTAQACLMLVKLMSSMPTYETHAKDFARTLDDYYAVPENEGCGITPASLSTWQISKPWLNELIKQCRLARKHINREGFTAKTLLEPHHYASRAQPLFNINKLLKQLLTHINKHQQHFTANFEADRLIFTNEFYTLYSKTETKDE